MSVHGRAGEYIDDELTHDEERAFLHHLADCRVCGAALNDELQLRSREKELSSRPRRPRFDDLMPDRKRVFAIGCGTSVLAVMLALLMIPPGAETTKGPVAGTFTIPRAPEQDPVPRMTVSITPSETAYRGATSSAVSARPGDRLHVAATISSESAVEVRIYRGAHELVARCPGDEGPDCLLQDGAIESRYTLHARGEYQVQLLQTPGPLPPATGDREADLRAVRGSGGRVAELKIIVVN